MQKPSLKHPLTVLAILAGTTFAHAEETPATDIKKTDVEIRQLRTKNPSEFRKLVTKSQYALCMLGYLAPPYTGIEDEKTLAAYATFRAKKGLKGGVKLDAATLFGVLQDMSELPGAAAMQTINLPGFTFYAGQDTIRARGTWASDGAQVANPLQTTLLECYRDFGICILNQAEIDTFFNSKTLTTNTEILDIERWDQYEMVTKPKDALCARWTTRISLKAKTVTSTRTRIGDDKGCEHIDSKDWVLRLTDGIAVMRSEQKKQAEQYARSLGRDCPIPEM